MAVYDEPFEKGDVLTPAQCIEMAEDLLQGSNNAYIDMVQICGEDPEAMLDPQVFQMHMVIKGNIRAGIDLAREWRELGLAKTEAEQLAKAEEEFKRLDAELSGERLPSRRAPWHG